jgi:hypothetical protein
VSNGKAYIELEDDHISGPGAVVVWTKADSVTPVRRLQLWSLLWTVTAP